MAAPRRIQQLLLSPLTHEYARLKKKSPVLSHFSPWLLSLPSALSALLAVLLGSGAVATLGYLCSAMNIHRETSLRMRTPAQTTKAVCMPERNVWCPPPVFPGSRSL